MGANHSESLMLSGDVECNPRFESGGNVLFRTFGKQFGFIYTDGKKVYVRPITDDGLASIPYVLHEEEESIIQQPCWGVSGKELHSCYCCWKVMRSRPYVDFFLLCRKDTGEVAARFVGSIKSAPVRNNGIVWMEVAPITTVAVVEERKMTMYRVLNNSVNSQKSFVLERSKPPFIGALWADLSAALIAYNKNTLFLFKPTVNDKFCLLKSVDWALTFPLDDALAEQSVVTALLIRSTNYLLILSEQKSSSRGKSIRETEQPTECQEDDAVYTELLYVSAPKPQSASKLLLVSYDTAYQTVHKLTSVPVSRIRRPDILCITPYSGLLAVGGNESEWVMIFGIDETYNFVLIDELRFNDSAVKGLSNYVLKAPQRSTYDDCKQIQSYLVVYTSAYGAAEAKPTFIRIAAIRWPLQIDMLSGVCETEVKQQSPDGAINTRKVVLLNPSVLQSESAAQEAARLNAAQLQSRSSPGASEPLRRSRSHMNEDWHRRNSTQSSKASDECPLLKPWTSVLDHDGCASSCVDLLFIEPERVCELHRICSASENVDVSKADLMAKVNQYDLKQRDGGRPPLYRVERFALDECSTIGFDLLLTLFEIRDVAVLFCETGPLKPGSFPVWLEASPGHARSLPLRLQNNDFYFITGHASDLCRHVIEKP